MGYDTNLSSIPCLLGSGTLLVSDSLNHTSLVNGARSSKAYIRVFNNNDPEHLDQILKEAVLNGQPKYHRPWKKIVVLVEGIYSMEGSICRLKDIVRVCKKYKAYIYVDEAHSIGALGHTGRGICEYSGVNPNDIGKLYIFLTTVLSIILLLNRYFNGYLYKGLLIPLNSIIYC